MELTEEQRKLAIEKFRSKVENFPTEEERKDVIFNSLDSILQAIGSYLNDDKLEFKREAIDDEDVVTYTSTYGTFSQVVTHDSASAFFADCLKLPLKNCREIRDTKKIIDNYFKG